MLIRRASSLRRTLLVVLLLGLALSVGAELWVSWRTAIAAANAAYDRSLLGAIKSIDSNISTQSGGLGVELPFRMLEFFELTASGRVYYRVATEDGLVEIGSAGLPLPAQPLVTGRPYFDDAQYFDEPVRVGTYARMLERPIAGQMQPQRVLIQVAETLESRQAFTRQLLWQAIARDAVLIVAAIALLAGAVGWALRPLARLRDEVRSRDANDVTPISAEGIPAEVQPLVEAINHHIERHHQQAQARRRFIDDASHQLRTPLTTLATQVAYALREPDPAAQTLALQAIKAQLDETVRQTNQMLLLARSDSAQMDLEPVDLQALAQDLVRRWWPEARARGIDLGLEAVPQPLTVLAQPGLLREALANLLHNAIRYTPADGHVTLQLSAHGRHARLEVVDSGPGIPAEELPRAGERFFRASNAQHAGSGLGLAIVRSIAERLGGSLSLSAVGSPVRSAAGSATESANESATESAGGLRVCMELPLIAPLPG